MFNRMTRRKIAKKAKSKLKDMLNDKGFRNWLVDYLFMVSKPEDLLALFNMYKAGYSPDHVEKVSNLAKETQAKEQQEDAGN